MVVESVGIGEIGTANGNGVLRTLLGSCVGVVLYDQRQQAAGLVHIQLPDSGGRTDPLPGKFADTGIPELRRRVQGISRLPLDLVAHIAGGADMFPAKRSPSVGEQNIQAVENVLVNLGIQIVNRHCGGKRARRLVFHVSTGDFRIELVNVKERRPKSEP